ncbi:MAG: LLM class F420-dependent oxidoreductase [Acidimicrobiales bacterium]|nr:LLM class F420-dependent oxidoreductase [Acidimicrobiales bacterium]MCB1251357.1 LLM class F420-dependent oxidoreductase [Acidimicrobiales bacterium]
MKLGMQLQYAGGFKESAAQVAEYERAGLDVVWVAEAYGFDAPSFMGYLAATTETITIASGILPIYTRTPTLLAMTAAGVDAMTDGRCILGLGASGPQVIEGFHGLPYDAPIGRTREIIEICRQVWKRERVEHHGKYYELPLDPSKGTGLGKPLKIISHPVRDRIPIHVASLGPRNVEMTAELADGWLPIFYMPERAREVWGADLDAGFAKRADDLGPMDVVAGGMLCITDDPSSVLDFGRAMAALYIGGMGARDRNFYNQLACRYGYEAEAREIQDLYLDGHKKEAAEKVPAEFLELTNLVGPEGFVRDRIAAYREAGVTILNVVPIGPNPTELLEQVKAWAD